MFCCTQGYFTFFSFLSLSPQPGFSIDSKTLKERGQFLLFCSFFSNSGSIAKGTYNFSKNSTCSLSRCLSLGWLYNLKSLSFLICKTAILVCISVRIRNYVCKMPMKDQVLKKRCFLLLLQLSATSHRAFYVSIHQVPMKSQMKLSSFHMKLW